MTKVFYAEANYSDEEIDAVIKVLRENRLALMCGENVRALEGQVAKLFNKNIYGYVYGSRRYTELNFNHFKRSRCPSGRPAKNS